MSWTNAYSLEQAGKFLRSARKEQGYTQQEFAELVGVSHATLSAMENGLPVRSCHLERALQLLGFRAVLVPKSAQVAVREISQSKEVGA